MEKHLVEQTVEKRGVGCAQERQAGEGKADATVEETGKLGLKSKEEARLR